MFSDELEQSHSSSDSDNLMNLPHLMEEGSREDLEGTSPQDQVPSTPVTISEIKQKFGAARLDGHKICFYNSDRQFLFDAWVESLPLYWRYFIDIVRPTVSVLILVLLYTTYKTKSLLLPSLFYRCNKFSGRKRCHVNNV